MRLLAKFSLIFVVVFGVGLGAAAYLFYGLLQRNAREQVLYNAQLLMDTALAMRSYTIDQVKPAIGETMDQLRTQSQDPADEVFRDLCAKRGLVGKRVFRPQTVPAFAATELFAQLRSPLNTFISGWFLKALMTSSSQSRARFRGFVGLRAASL